MSMSDSMASMSHQWASQRNTEKQRICLTTLKGIYTEWLQAFSCTFIFFQVPLSEGISAFLICLQVQMTAAGFCFATIHSADTPAFNLLHHQNNGSPIDTCEVGSNHRMKVFQCRGTSQETIQKILLDTPLFARSGFNRGHGNSYLLHVGELFLYNQVEVEHYTFFLVPTEAHLEGPIPPAIASGLDQNIQVHHCGGLWVYHGIGFDRLDILTSLGGNDSSMGQPDVCVVCCLGPNAGSCQGPSRGRAWGDEDRSGP